MRYPSRHVADLARWGKQHDLVYEGVVKSGHVRFRLPDGSIYTTASTPSEIHATQNAMRDICRMLGVPYVSGRKAGRYRNQRRQGFSMRHALMEKNPALSGEYTTGAIEVVIPERVDLQLLKLRQERDELAERYKREPFPYVAQLLTQAECRLALCEAGDLDW